MADLEGRNIRLTWLGGLVVGQRDAAPPWYTGRANSRKINDFAIFGGGRSTAYFCYLLRGSPNFGDPGPKDFSGVNLATSRARCVQESSRDFGHRWPSTSTAGGDRRLGGTDNFARHGWLGGLVVGQRDAAPPWYTGRANSRKSTILRSSGEEGRQLLPIS